MAEKSKTTNMNQPDMTELTDRAMKNYEQALRTGLKLQEEAGRWWTQAWSQASAGADWQKRFETATSLAGGMMPIAQKRLQEVLTFMEQNSKSSAELLRKAVEAAQTPGIPESQAKWMSFWISSMGAMRDNVEALTTLNSRAIDSWLSFVKNSNETAAKAAA